jgi:hypothetical protein
MALLLRTGASQVLEVRFDHFTLPGRKVLGQLDHGLLALLGRKRAPGLDNFLELLLIDVAGTSARSAVTVILRA